MNIALQTQIVINNIKRVSKFSQPLLADVKIHVKEYLQAATGMIETPPLTASREQMDKYIYLLAVQLVYRRQQLSFISQHIKKEKQYFEVIERAIRIAGVLKEKVCIEVLMQDEVWRKTKFHYFNEQGVEIQKDGGIKQVSLLEILVNDQKNVTLLQYKPLLQTQVQMFLCSDYGNVNALKTILQQEQNFPIELMDGALLKACRLGHTEVVLFLFQWLKERGSQEIISYRFLWLLYYATTHGCLETLSCLFQTEEIHPISLSRIELLFGDAIEEGQLVVADFLLEKIVALKLSQTQKDVVLADYKKNVLVETLKKILFVSSYFAHRKRFCILLKNNVSQLLSVKDLEELFMHALSHHQEDIACDLLRYLRAKLVIQIPKKQLMNIFDAIVCFGKKKLLHIFLREWNAEFQRMELIGPLCMAASRGDMEIVQILLQEGKHLLDQQGREKVFIESAFFGWANVVSLFSEEKQDMEISQEAVIEALMQSISQGHVEVAQKLMKEFLRKTLSTHEEFLLNQKLITALLRAARQNHDGTVDCILKNLETIPYDKAIPATLEAAVTVKQWGEEIAQSGFYDDGSNVFQEKITVVPAVYFCSTHKKKFMREQQERLFNEKKVKEIEKAFIEVSLFSQSALIPAEIVDLFKTKTNKKIFSEAITEPFLYSKGLSLRGRTEFLEIIRHLLWEKSAQVVERAFIEAAFFGYAEIIPVFLEEEKKNEKMSKEAVIEALVVAITNGHVHAVYLLLEALKEVQILDHEKSMVEEKLDIALLRAVRKNHQAIVMLVLERWGKISQETAIHLKSEAMVRGWDRETIQNIENHISAMQWEIEMEHSIGGRKEICVQIPTRFLC